MQFNMILASCFGLVVAERTSFQRWWPHDRPIRYCFPFREAILVSLPHTWIRTMIRHPFPIGIALTTVKNHSQSFGLSPGNWTRTYLPGPCAVDHYGRQYLDVGYTCRPGGCEPSCEALRWLPHTPPQSRPSRHTLRHTPPSITVTTLPRLQIKQAHPSPMNALSGLTSTLPWP